VLEKAPPQPDRMARRREAGLGIILAANDQHALGSSVAVWLSRAAIMLPVGEALRPRQSGDWLPHEAFYKHFVAGISYPSAMNAMACVPEGRPTSRG
jgi:hypothetical protein